MYAEIVTEPGIITAANMKTALVQVLTGETDINNLPQGINKIKSKIRFSINVAGWTQHDGEDVLKSPLSYTFDHLKYCRLYITNILFHFKAYEEWDETTHTGTNITANSSASFSLRWSLTAETVFYISASERYILMNTNYDSIWGDTNYSCFIGLFEFENRLINHGTDYVPYFGILVGSQMLRPSTNYVFNAHYGYCFYLCRSLSYARQEILADIVFCTPIGAINVGMSQDFLFPNGWNKEIIMPDPPNILIKIPLALNKPINYIMGIGWIHTACNTWFLPRATEHGDSKKGTILSHNSGEYIAFNAGNSFYWAVPNG